MRAVIYCRVSTDKQEKDGTSLETQEARCREYASEKGWQVVMCYREAFSGAKYRERPLLTEARGLLRNKQADVLLCYALDRLSRNQTHTAVIADDIEHAGGQLAFVTEDFEDSAVGKFLRQAKSFAAEVEREKFAERSQRGMLAKMQGGKPRPGPRPLYGYRYADASKRYLLPDEVTAPVVKRVFTLARGGASLRTICAALDAEGVPRPYKAKHWQPSSVNKMLANPAYIGSAAAMRYTKTDMPAIPLPEGTLPPLVDAETFAVVAGKLARNKQDSVRNARFPEAFLLRGMVFCGQCGRAAAAQSEARKGGFLHRYAVNTSTTSHRDCPSASMIAHELDSLVWAKVEALMREGVLEKELARVREAPAPYEHEEAALNRTWGELERTKESLTRSLLGVAPEDDFTRAIVLNQLREVGEREQQMWGELEALRAWRLETHNIVLNFRRLTVTYRKRETLTFTEKRELLAALGVKITLYPHDHLPRFMATANIPLEAEGESSVSPTARSSTCAIPSWGRKARARGKSARRSCSARHRSTVR